MEIQDVFARIKARMLEGMVFHDEMSRYFDFLNLCGYRDEQRKHYHDETENYCKLCKYYGHHYNKLIPHTDMERPNVIPESWYMYSRGDVDAGTKRNAVKSAMRKWVEWEADTKELFEDMCGELLDIRELAAAEHLKQYINDVDYELSYVREKHMDLESVEYDLSFMLSEQ